MTIFRLHVARLTDIVTTKSGTTLLDIDYTFDNVGNILTAKHNVGGGGLTTYTYDDLNRLMSATATLSNTYTRSWQYNAIGNMTQRNDGGGALTYTYDPAHKHAVKQVGANYFCYDANGNMTRRNSNAACSSGDQLFYDVENRMTQMVVGSTTTNLAYNGDGTRVKRQVVGVGTTYYIGNHYEVYVPQAGATTFNKYYYFGKQRVALRVGANTPLYLHGDHLGSTSATTNSTGTSTSSQLYYAFGNVRATTGTVPTDFGFTGQKRDASANLMYYNARYYDTYLNRWTSPDSIVPQPSNPQALNRYAYAFNNPINLIDPSGHAPQFPGDDPNNPDPCATDWCWENRWYEAHGYTWNDRRDDWRIGGDPTFYDEGIMDEVIHEAGITIVTPATAAQKESIARGVAMLGRALSGGVPHLRNLLGRTSVFIGPHSPTFCGLGANPCSPPSLGNMTHEVFLPEQVFINYGANMHMIVVHELGHVIDWQSHIGLDPHGNFAGSFSDVWSYEPLTSYAATGTFSNWERFAEAVAVYVFRQDYARVAQFRNMNPNDFQVQMDRMQALLEGWY